MARGNRFLFGAALLVVLGVWPVLFNQLTRAGDDTGGPVFQLTPPPARANVVAASDPDSIADVAERAVESVVSIHTASGWGAMGVGSGVIVGSDGVIVTNHHVVKGAQRIRVTLADGRQFGAELVGTDAATDLAVLRLDGKPKNLTAIKLGDSSKVRLGEVVLAIGNPLDVGHTVTMGIISAKGRGNGTARFENFLQTDAAINQGNSGGALVNMRGELIGINQSIATASRSRGNDGIGFAIPSNMAEPVIRSLLKDGRVTRAWLGVSIRDLDARIANEHDLPVAAGVVVLDVVPDSPAATAGLRPGDIIQTIRGERVRSAHQLTSLVATAGVGAEVEITLLRDKSPLTMTATLTDQSSLQ